MHTAVDGGPSAGRETRIAVLTTGGTIASRPSAGGTIADVDGHELVRACAGSGAVVRELLRVGSYELQTEDMLAIVRAVVAEARRVDGVVTTHGTDAMEETAFLVDLFHDGEAPVVFCGGSARRLPGGS